MVFEPPSWVPKLPIGAFELHPQPYYLLIKTDPPDSIPISEFLRNEKYGRRPVASSRNPFTCGLTGRTATVDEFFRRSDSLAKALSKRTGWQPNEGTCWDKVVGIFSFNTVSCINT